MSVASRLADREAKRTVMYAAMVLAGLVFVSTLVLPLPAATNQLVAALAFGVMSGLWLGHLVYSI